MPKYRITWSAGEEEIEAPDEGAAMDDALDSVVMESEHIEGDEEGDDEEETPEAEAGPSEPA